jgi:hypothetical protein
MLWALNGLIVRVSGNGWLFALTTVLAFGSLTILMQIGEAFPAVAGGAQPFDLQNELTAAEVLAQLPGYTEQARGLYLQFSAIDFVFPFAAGLFLAAIAAFSMRHAFPAAYGWLTARSLLPLMMLGTLFDWCENVAALSAIYSWPDTGAGLATAPVIAKKLKLTMVIASQLLAALLLLAAAAAWIGRRLRAP